MQLVGVTWWWGRAEGPRRSSEPLCHLPCSNLSWLGYGCLKQDWTLITVNTIGAALQTLYILAYLYYSPAKVGARLPGLMGGWRDPHPDCPPPLCPSAPCCCTACCSWPCWLLATATSPS